MGQRRVLTKSPCTYSQKDFSYGPRICNGERAVSLMNGSIKLHVSAWKNKIATTPHNIPKNKLKWVRHHNWKTENISTEDMRNLE